MIYLRFLKELLADVSRTGLLVGHNVAYDLDVITHECSREKIDISKVQGEAEFLYDDGSGRVFVRFRSHPVQDSSIPNSVRRMRN